MDSNSWTLFKNMQELYGVHKWRTRNTKKKNKEKIEAACKNRKEKAWKEFREKLDIDSKRNQELFYKVMKALRSRKEEQSIYKIYKMK